MKVLIVDDDQQVLVGMEGAIDWNAYGVKNVMTANNGEEALRIFNEQEPDIVITDIEMPVMNGLELGRKIKEISSKTKVIIISGHSDFGYAKQAIKYGIIAYELKPLRVEQLKKLVKDVVKEIEEERGKQRQLDYFKKSYMQSLIRSTLSGQINEIKKLKEEFNFYFGWDSAHYFILINLKIDNNRKVPAGMRPQLKIDLYSKLYEYLDRRNTFVNDYTWDQMMIIMRVDRNLYEVQWSEVQFRKLMEYINSFVEVQYDTTVSIGVSTPGNLVNLSGMYQQTMIALEKKFYKGYRGLYFYSRNKPQSKQSYYFPHENEWKENVCSLNKEGIMRIIDNEFDAIRKGELCTREEVKNLCLNCSVILIRTIRDEGINADLLFKDDMKEFYSIPDFETLDEYKQWMINRFDKCMSVLDDFKGVKTNIPLVRAIEYIKDYYAKELSIVMVAEYIGLSPNYFSHLFKKEFGLSFRDYINQIRIKKAKELIKKSDLLYSEVADIVGYKDYKYFVRMFKKWEGISPSQVKRKIE